MPPVLRLALSNEMIPRKSITHWLAALLAGAFLQATPLAISAAAPGIKKIKDVTIYRSPDFYCSFPSIVRRPDGELLVAFRRAPDRRKFGGGSYSHTDPNSYLVSVRSKDSGQTWSKEPQLIYAHPLAGSQDPCLVQLSDGSILCTSYGWALLDPKQIANLKQPLFVNGGKYAFLGGYILRSKDGGHAWEAPIIPAAPLTGEIGLDIFGRPLPAYNRGAMGEGADGRLYWVVATFGAITPRRTENHLMISEDKGLTWKYSAPVAVDPKVQFNETSIYETPKGDLVAFIRTANFNDHLVVARSTDKGRSFKWTDAGIQGHPYHAIRLPDQRVLLVYGYRHAPFGIRARVLDAECTNISAAPEVILRDDGGTGDLGYPWATLLSKNRALVVYYFNQADGSRTIESTVVEIL